MRSVAEIQAEITQVQAELRQASLELEAFEKKASDVMKEQDTDPEWRMARRQYIDTGDMNGITSWYNRRDQRKRDQQNYEISMRESGMDGKTVVKDLEDALAAQAKQKALGMPTAEEDLKVDRATAAYKEKYGKEPDVEAILSKLNLSKDPLLQKFNVLQKIFDNNKLKLTDEQVQWLRDNRDDLPEVVQPEADAIIAAVDQGADDTVETKNKKKQAAAKREQEAANSIPEATIKSTKTGNQLKGTDSKGNVHTFTVVSTDGGNSKGLENSGHKIVRKVEI